MGEFDPHSSPEFSSPQKNLWACTQVLHAIIEEKIQVLVEPIYTIP